MHDLIAAFVAGALVGASALVLLRHEIQLTQSSHTLGVLVVTGVVLAAGMWNWSRALLLRTEQEIGARARPPLPRAWARFIAVGVVLLLLYLALFAALVFA